ncbi:general secretion pathway protein [Yersinia frederiksenii]|nr:general secretion pathway protein [Yersinia frederiksenii]
MPVFNYAAINPQGVKIKGCIDAENIFSARNTLYQRNLYLLNVRIKRVNFFTRVTKYFNKVDKKDLILITRQMSILVNAAIPLDEVLEIIEKQSVKSNVKDMIHEIRKRLIEGHSFSDSLSLYSNVFNILYRSMITAGEVSGHLDIVLEKLADHIEKTYKVQRKIMQALIYPGFLFFISISVVVILLSIVIPSLLEQFTFYEKELPMSTKLLMVFSYWVKDNSLIIIIISSLFLVLFNLAIRVKKINLFFDGFYLKVPMLGKTISRLNIVRYLRMMAILSSNGVSLIKSMKISNGVLTNQYIKQQLLNSVTSVSEGDSLSSSLASCQVFSPIILHLISSGERSGQLNMILERVTDIQEQELMDQIGIFTTLLEPMIMIFMAGFVFFIVLAIFQPILEMNNLIL